GNDILVGGAGDEILIAGSTAYDNNSAVLAQIMSIWTSNASYSSRVTTLRNGLLKADTTVYDDGATDIVSGGSGNDVFYINNDGSNQDILADRTGNEVVIDLDFIPS